MPGTLLIILIVVVWVFVLAPLVLGGNSKPIRRAGEAYDDTRVLHQGGTEPVAPRRRPKLTAADVHRYDNDDTHDLEVVDVEPAADEPVLIDDTEPHSFRGLFTKRVADEDTEDTADSTVSTVEGEVIDTDSADELDDNDAIVAEELDEELDEEPVATVDEDDDESAHPYDTDESYLSAEDFGYVSEKAAVVDLAAEEIEEPEAPAEDESEESTELTDEDLAWAESRRGRGGWDPVADKTTSLNRYQRRQRTFLGLVAALVVAVVLGIIVGGWAWTGTVVVGALIVWYLVALRSLVRQEQALRARRIRQLRRARLGVKSADKSAPIPRELRRPGAVIVEADDESPDFDHLPMTYSHFDEDEYDYAPHTERAG